MRLSKLPIKTLREAPKDADTINHQLLVQAGFVRQLMAGVYSYLPLGLKVLRNIEKVVREEMDAIGGQEVLMPMLHPAAIWKQSGGWDKVDVLFKLQSRTEKEYALSQSHEEVASPIAKEAIGSYKDLPFSMYQIQWKFRDELRSKSGILRGREFLMKDMYSFHETQADFEEYYKKVKQAYLKIFKRLGLEAKVTEASGGGFSEKVSYEFEVLTDAGEANILFCDSCDYCVNVDDLTDHQEGETCANCRQGVLGKALASEVGNVFDLGQKYAKAFEVTFTSKDGERMYPIMGCYGIGITRTMGVIVEKFHDDRGIVWPKEVAPFAVHLVGLKDATAVYEQLKSSGIDVLYDDTDRPAGQKFADADLMGIPVRLVISEKTGDKIEWKERASKDTTLLTIDEVINRLSQ